MGCVSATAGCLLFLFNLFFFLCGGVLLGVCIYLAVDGSGLTIKDVTIPGAPSQGVWAAAVYLGILVGAFVFVVGFLGCCGARKEGSCMLKLYKILVISCILLEIVIAILALVFNAQVSTNVAISMQSSIKNDYKEPNATTANSGDTTSYNWNVAQSEWQCCGSFSYSDYHGSTFTRTTKLIVPYECCVRKPGTPKSDLSYNNVQDYNTCQNEAKGTVGPYSQLYSEGCYTKTKNWVKQKSNILIAIGFTFAGLQVIGLVLAICYKPE